MAADAFIIAHDNHFNKSILEQNALYFKSSEDIKDLILHLEMHLRKKDTFLKANQKKIDEKFRWERIIDEYEELFTEIIAQD